jgi:hypothetical protein
MRPSLLHPRSEPRHSRRSRRSAGRAARTQAPVREPAVRAADPAVRRVREAGGPVDRASYTCQCGYLFSAAVSTTVSCPHCGTDQAW